jgi:hypothetical protein
MMQENRQQEIIPEIIEEEKDIKVLLINDELFIL